VVRQCALIVEAASRGGFHDRYAHAQLPTGHVEPQLREVRVRGQPRRPLEQARELVLGQPERGSQVAEARVIGQSGPHHLLRGTEAPTITGAGLDPPAAVAVPAEQRAERHHK
jgi:hypothetical protein